MKKKIFICSFSLFFFSLVQIIFHSWKCCLEIYVLAVSKTCVNSFHLSYTMSTLMFSYSLF